MVHVVALHGLLINAVKPPQSSTDYISSGLDAQGLHSCLSAHTEELVSLKQIKKSLRH